MSDSEDVKDIDQFLIETAFSSYEVQRTITQHLPIPDLKSLRLVSRLWLIPTFIPLKAQTHVLLTSATSLQSFISFLQTNPNPGISYSNLSLKIDQSQFTSLQQVVELFGHLWQLCSGSALGLALTVPWTCAHPLLEIIFGREGHSSMKLERLSLGLDEVESGSSENWAEVREKDTQESQEDKDDLHDSGESEKPEEKTNKISTVKKITSLTSLTLNVSIVLNCEKRVFPFGWAEFVERCPNLEHLSVQSDYASGHFRRIVGAMAERGVRLRTIKIGTRDQRLFSDDFLVKLHQLTFPQTSCVSLGFLPSITHKTPLDPILTLCASSLRHLTFLQIRTSNQANLTCFSSSDPTVFPHLHTLRMTKELLPNLQFLRKMPSLRRLEIFRDSTLGQHDTLSNPVIRTGLNVSLCVEGLQTLLIEPFVPEEHVWRLTRWFPWLQRLQLKANDRIARIIFMQWKGLKELCLIAEISRDNNDIVRSALTDEGITGFSKEALQRLSEDRVEEEEELGRAGNNVGGEQREAAYIGDLTKLETCKLQAIPDYLTGLTDFSVHFGLKQLPALTSLTLVKTLITPVAADQLRSKGIAVTLSKS